MEALDRMLRESLPMLAQGSAPRLVQDERHATWATKRTPAEGRIDWTLPAAEIERMIRAVGRPYAGAFNETKAERRTVWAARPWPAYARKRTLPGQGIGRRARRGRMCQYGAMMRGDGS